jgi:uncharacterized tellurite resistance protein B-like protein
MTTEAISSSQGENRGGPTEVDHLAEGIGVTDDTPPRGWFTRLASRYFRKNLERAAQLHETVSEITAPVRAEKAITTACVKSAISGAACGAVSTAATVITAQTEGIGGFVAVPLAGLAIGGEMVFRAIIHVGLTCELAHIFGVRFDADDQDDLWRLYALAFGAHAAEAKEGGDPGKGLVEEVTHLEGEQVGERIGHLLVGESLMRNIVPFVGIVTSAVTNYLLTRKLGHTVRRYMRYHRAMNDALARAEGACGAHLDLLIEGMWFIFTADGKLEPEEAACLAHMLRELDPVQRRAVTQRFTDDEIDWMVRIKKELPDDVRDPFLHALEVAAALDKEISLPERKILRRVANIFGKEFDTEHLALLVTEFEERGVLAAGASHHRA